ncbi:MAG: hypothetical protein ABJA16_06310 [Nakamurella sp.]
MKISGKGWPRSHPPGQCAHLLAATGHPAEARYAYAAVLALTKDPTVRAFLVDSSAALPISRDR